MKLSIQDLKKALKKIEEISNDMHININLTGHEIALQFKDKYDSQTEIRLFEDSSMLPKIRKESFL